MNIFILDDDIDRCAEYHCDQHVGNQIKEAGQMLSSAIIIDNIIGPAPRALTKEELKELRKFNDTWKIWPVEKRPWPVYLLAHPNHPCTIWVRESIENFNYLVCLANALGSEHHYRYGTWYKTLWSVINKLPDPKHIPNRAMTKHALAMPDYFKTDDVIASYRDFYKADKWEFATWKHRHKPEWW